MDKLNSQTKHSQSFKMNLIKTENTETNEIIWLNDGRRRKSNSVNLINSIAATFAATTRTAATIIKNKISSATSMPLNTQRKFVLPSISSITINDSLIRKNVMKLARTMNLLKSYKLFIITCHLIVNILLLITIIRTLVIKLFNLMKFHINFMYKHLIKTKLNILLYLCWCAIILQETTEAFPATSLLPIPAATIPIIRFHNTSTGHNLIIQKSNISSSNNQHQHQQHQQNRTLNHLLTNINLSELRIIKPAIARRKPFNTSQQQQQQNSEQKSHQYYLQNRQHHQHHHHLHQRAVNNPGEMAHNKPSIPVFSHVIKQMNTSLQKMRTLFENFLHVRDNSNSHKMWETWQKHNLSIQYPNRLPSKLKNQTYAKIETFYLNLNGYQQMCQDIIEDTIKHRNEIEHGENYKAQFIIDFFEQIKTEVHRILLETEKCLAALAIPKPDLQYNHITYDHKMQRKPKEFLSVHNLIQEIEGMHNILRQQRKLAT